MKEANWRLAGGAVDEVGGCVVEVVVHSGPDLVGQRAAGAVGDSGRAHPRARPSCAPSRRRALPSRWRRACAAFAGGAGPSPRCSGGARPSTGPGSLRAAFGMVPCPSGTSAATTSRPRPRDRTCPPARRRTAGLPPPRTPSAAPASPRASTPSGSRPPHAACPPRCRRARVVRRRLARSRLAAYGQSPGRPDPSPFTSAGAFSARPLAAPGRRVSECRYRRWL